MPSKDEDVNTNPFMLKEISLCQSPRPGRTNASCTIIMWVLVQKEISAISLSDICTSQATRDEGYSLPDLVKYCQLLSWNVIPSHLWFQPYLFASLSNALSIIWPHRSAT